MITDIASFLSYFAGVNRRALRDIGALPAEAETWQPPGGEGEDAWDIAQLVKHMAMSRIWVAGAYVGGTWEAIAWEGPTAMREDWQRALEESGAKFTEMLAGTPDDWLRRKMPSMDGSDKSISGWRALMLMVEHDIHHRSQIDTYAGIMGWPVPQIYGRRAEEVGLARGGPSL